MRSVPPKVLFLGNGLNRAYGGLEWTKAIERIQTNNNINIASSYYQKVPATLMAIVATENRIEDALSTKEAEDIVFGVDDMSLMYTPLRNLIHSGFHYILTTNYSYEIERAIDKKFSRKGKYNSLRIRDFNKSTQGDPEERCLLHTYNELEDSFGSYKIWHIHGEGRKIKTVALGHHFYGKLLGKYKDEVELIEQNITDSTGKAIRKEYESWIDLFLNGDVYMVGFGLDFAEYDIWWLLVQKAALGRGKVFFYNPRENNEAKFSLIEVLNGEAICLGCNSPRDYKVFYNKVIEDVILKMK